MLHKYEKVLYEKRTGHGVKIHDAVCWSVSYRNIRWSPNPQTCVPLFRNRVFADVIELRWQHYSGPSSNLTSVLIRREDRDRGKMPSEKGGRFEWCIYKPKNTKECQLLEEARGEAWKRVSLKALRRNQTCWHLDFRILVSGTETQ